MVMTCFFFVLGFLPIKLLTLSAVQVNNTLTCTQWDIVHFEVSEFCDVCLAYTLCPGHTAGGTSRS